MAQYDLYSAKAADFRAKAASATSDMMRQEYERLAAVYLRLADQIKRTALVIDFEFPPKDEKD